MKNTHLMTVIADDGHPWPLVDDAGNTLGFAQRGEWPAAWVSITDAASLPLVAAYRLRFTVASAETVRIFVSADERYDLFLDGVRVSRGPERGDPLHWYYDTLELPLTPGEHLLVARVWSLGIGRAPWSQLSLRHGLLLAAADLAWNAVLGTGVANWEGMRLPGYRFRGGNHVAWASDEHIDAGAFPWDFEHGAGEGWRALRVNDRGRSACASSLVHTYEHALVPGRLPALLAAVRQVGTIRQVDDPGTLDSAGIPYQQELHLVSEVEQWQHLVTAAQAITVPPHTRRRVLIDLDNYYNAYPQLSFSGGTGAEIRLGWAEGLYEGDNTRTPKGNRDIVASKYFLGPHDAILPDGRADACWQPLWWRAGRYLELQVATADSPLMLHSLAIEETRYPYESEGTFSSDDEHLARLLPICERTVQNCAHESYMDCPYYEQQYWVGDARVQMLISHQLFRDPRLVRRCIEYIGSTRDSEGIVLGRYPAPQRLWIPSFALAWCGMVYDYARYRGDHAFIARMMPALRGTLDALLAGAGDDGLLRTPKGWNYTDWVSGANPAWEMGEPPHSFAQPSAILNWQVVQTMSLAAKLEQWLDEPEYAARWDRRAEELTRACCAAFWQPERGLFSDSPQGTSCSEHAQCMAILSGHLSPETLATLAQTLPTDTGLARTSLYYDHYLFEALTSIGRIDALFTRLAPYFVFADRGLRTTPETIEIKRSDCHAWAAHPRYHVSASILGVRPASWGYATVEIAPQLGPLQHASGVIPHPNGGDIVVTLQRDGARLRGKITLPPGITGTFRYAGETIELQAGEQAI